MEDNQDLARPRDEVRIVDGRQSRSHLHTKDPRYEYLEDCLVTSVEISHTQETRYEYLKAVSRDLAHPRAEIRVPVGHQSRSRTPKKRGIST